MKNAFHGNTEDTAKSILAAGLEYGVSLGRRAPMHCMHVDCVMEIIRAGLKPVLVIGSVNGPDSPMYDPVRNPLTVEQQKEQFRQAFGDMDYNEALTLTLEDTVDDEAWMELFSAKLKEVGLLDKSVIHFRSKAADALQADAAVKPLSRYSESFINNGMAIWQSYNSRIEDDNINASDIRNYDLDHLTDAQRALMAAPDYIVSLARAAREANPDAGLLAAKGVPLTVMDLALDRLWREAGIRTADILGAAEDESLSSIAKAATAKVKTRGGDNVVEFPAAKKPLLLLGPSVSKDTAKALTEDGFFDSIGASIGKFQSDEHFVELFFGEKADYEANAEKLKGATVTIVQSTGAPVGDNVQYLLEMIHTAKLYGAAKVIVVVPFAAYSRQDRPFDGRFTSVSVDLFAKQLEAAGADEVVSFTMHSQAAIAAHQKVFGDNFKALSASEIFAKHLTGKLCLNASEIMVGAPDGADKLGDEGQRRAHELDTALSGTFNENALFKIAKVHTGVNKTAIASFEGDVAGKDCVVIDDMVDGGSTMLNAARLLKQKGAASVTCVFTHPVLTGGADSLEKLLMEKIDGKFVIDRLVTTDALPDVVEKIAALTLKYPELADRIDVVPLGPAILAEMKQELQIAPKAAAKVAAFAGSKPA